MCLLGSPLEINPWGPEGTAQERQKETLSCDGLGQPLGSSGARMALQSCVTLGRDGQVFTPRPEQSLHMGPQKDGLWATWLCSGGRPQRG